MKRIILLLMSFVVAISASAAQRDTLRVLAIGNSFSEDAVEDHLYSLAAAEGVTLIIGNMYIGGCSLERHSDNMKGNKPAYLYKKVSADGKLTATPEFTLGNALNDEEWDYVTLQQASHFSGQKETYFPYLQELVDYVSSECPEAEIMFHMTWAYDPGTGHHGFANYDRDQLKMYNAIMEAVEYATDKVGIVSVIPSGTAIQNARTTVLEDKVNRPDGFHLSLPHGRYVAGCVWCEFLLGKNVKGNAYIAEGMTPEECRLAQKAAHAAVRRPGKIKRIR